MNFTKLQSAGNDFVLVEAEIVRVTSVAKTGVATGGALFFTFGGMTLGPALFGVLLGAGVDYGVAFTIVGGLALLSALPLLAGQR